MGELTTLRKMYNSFTKKTGERVEFVMISASDIDWEIKVTWQSEDDCGDPECNCGKPKWVVADRGTVFEYHNTPKEILDFEFDDGYGSANAPTVIAWSESYVITIHEYDGSEWLEWFPRNPIIK